MKPRSTKRAPRRRRNRRSYHPRWYAQNLLQAIATLLELPSTLGATRPGGWTPVLAWLAGLLMVLSRRPTLTGRLHEAVVALRALCQGFRAATYQGWCKALLAHAVALDLADAAFRRATLRVAQGVWRTQGWCVLAVDGSRLNLPRTRALRRWSPVAGKAHTAPQLFVTCLYHPASGLLWDYRVGPGTASERRHLRAMLARLPERTLLLADAGFVGFDLLTRLTRQHIAFVVRAGANVHLLEAPGGRGRRTDTPVWLWPPDHQTRHRPLGLRRLVLRHRGRTMTLLTNVRSPATLSKRQARALYARRWGIEVFYRQLKQTLGKRTLQSRTPERAVAEARLALQGLWLCGLLLGQTRQRHAGSPAVAAGLDVLRTALSPRSVVSARQWRQQWGRCRADPYPRRGPKRRGHWPDKKHDHPPGVAHVRPATERERRRAQRLTPLLLQT